SCPLGRSRRIHWRFTSGIACPPMRSKGASTAPSSPPAGKPGCSGEAGARQRNSRHVPVAVSLGRVHSNTSEGLFHRAQVDGGGERPQQQQEARPDALVARGGVGAVEDGQDVR